MPIVEAKQASKAADLLPRSRVLECLSVVFWLVTFAILADYAADLASTYSVAYLSSSTYRRLFNQIKGFVYGTYAAAGLAGLTWLSFILTLTLLGMDPPEFSPAAQRELTTAHRNLHP